MRSIMFVPLLAACILFDGDARATSLDCRTLNACVANLRALAKIPGPYAHQMTPEETALINQLLFFDDAVPKLIPLLADPDRNVAEIAAAALRDAKRIDPAYLPQVIAGLDRHLGWLAPALGRMQSVAAAREAVARLLVSEDAPSNQEGYAVTLSGRRAIPFIVEAARCSKSCGPEDQDVLGHVLGEMGPDRALAAPGLMAIAQDRATSKIVAVGALRIIAYLKDDGRSLEGQLIALRKRRPELDDAINDALIAVRSKEAGAILAQRLHARPDVDALWQLIDVGTAGHSAGPEVVRLLDSSNWDVRFEAARALGHIGFEPATDALIKTLDDTTDVRLVWIAAKSLGRLRANAARDALRRLATNHWYPPVREAATDALEHIDKEFAYKPDSDFSFRGYELMGRSLAVCKSLPVRKDEQRDRKLYADSAKKQLEKLSYSTEILSYGPADEPSAEESKDKVIKVTAANIREFRTLKEQVPDVALRVADGWLVGSDRGEWGGELVHVADNGLKQRILDVNVDDIFPLGDRIVASTGIAHMTMNSGMLYQLSRNSDGRWTATQWRALPGAPQLSWLAVSGELFEQTIGGGSILVSPDGSMRMAPCADK